MNNYASNKPHESLAEPQDITVSKADVIHALSLIFQYLCLCLKNVPESVFTTKNSTFSFVPKRFHVHGKTVMLSLVRQGMPHKPNNSFSPLGVRRLTIKFGSFQGPTNLQQLRWSHFCFMVNCSIAC